MKRIVILVPIEENEKIELHGVLEDVNFITLHEQKDGVLSKKTLGDIITKNISAIGVNDLIVELLADDDLYNVEEIVRTITPITETVVVQTSWNVTTFEEDFVRDSEKYNSELLDKVVDEMSNFVVDEGFLSLDFELEK